MCIVVNVTCRISHLQDHGSFQLNPLVTNGRMRILRRIVTNRENHRPVANYWQTLSYCFKIKYTMIWAVFTLTTNNHTITTAALNGKCWNDFKISSTNQIHLVKIIWTNQIFLKQYWYIFLIFSRIMRYMSKNKDQLQTKMTLRC